RKVATHGREWDEYFSHVPAVIAGILFLLGHHADHHVGKIVQVKRLPHRIAAGEELFGRFRSEKRYATGLAHVVPIVVTALTHVEAAHVCEWRVPAWSG